MCAECHSTNLDKNYNAATDTFATAWSEINVGCEACHGPASNHVQMAASGTLTSEHGLLLDLDDAGYTTWDMDVQRGIAARSEPRMRPPVQPEACGRCHSRRSVVADDYEYGLALLDTHMPSLLSDPLYYADGQIRGEVYVFGSFLQSKMYQAGVSCTDCHDPHAASLKTQGAVSDVCSTCHLPAKFAIRDHHRHAPTEVECVDCHMPSTTYMQVDGRRDHSFRVPRPDLTVATAAPNACNTCHDDRTAQWAAATTSEWYGEPASQHFALAIHAANSADSQANEKLLAVVVDRSMAGIVRATALSLYRSPLTTEQAQSVRNALGDADPLVRVGALRSLSILPPETVVQWAAGLLEDPVRAVRLAAFDAISPIQGVLPATSMRAFERVMQEFVATQAAIAERPEAHANLGNAYAARGDFASAERSYRFALDREPRASAIRVNLADLYRQLGRDAEAEVVLRAGLESDRDNAALHHSLGLLLVRSQRNEEALSELALAAELTPAVPRYIYVYAIALNSLGDSRRALDIIATAAQSFPADFDIGWAHVTFLSDAGRLDAARDAAADLLKRFPGNENALTLLQSFDAA